MNTAKEERGKQEDIVYEIRVELKPPIRIVGQAVRTSNAQQAKEQIVPRLMFDFMATRVNLISDRVDMQAFYGILDMSEESYDSDFFTWIAGVENTSASQPPSGLLMREYPAMLYAVVTCGGIVPVSLYSYVYREWIPKSDYDNAGRYAIQYHGPQFRGTLDAHSKVEVWFPIRPKEAIGEPVSPADQGENPEGDPIQPNDNIPYIVYDGADIDVLWDGHEEAIRWYESHLGWRVEQKESWKPDPRVSQGKMTHMGNGVWLESVITRERLPYHYAERGTVDPAVRWCWKTQDIARAYSKFKEDGIRVSEMMKGPDSRQFFDIWCTSEGARLTIHEDPKMLVEGFHDSEIRIGVKNLEHAVEWYQRFVGMRLVAVNPDKGYAQLTLGVNHKPDKVRTWILEQLPPNSSQGNVDGIIRPRCFIENRDAFFAYHQFLRNNGVQTGDLGGFVQRGYVKFHFYDPDGNCFNVCAF